MWGHTLLTGGCSTSIICECCGPHRGGLWQWRTLGEGEIKCSLWRAKNWRGLEVGTYGNVTEGNAFLSPPLSSQVRCYKIGLHFAYYSLLFICHNICLPFPGNLKGNKKVLSVVMCFESCSSATNERTPVVTHGRIHIFQKSPCNPFVENWFLKNGVMWVCHESGRRMLEQTVLAGSAELLQQRCSSSG